ncbi:hypothetical protein SPHS8_00472 [Sphingobium sp. S8]|nr:hypothetical protein SPHS8_00472 [Sphingobium sp. S8]
MIRKYSVFVSEPKLANQEIRLGRSCEQGSTGVLSYLRRLVWSPDRRGGAVSGRGWSGMARGQAPLWVLPGLQPYTGAKGEEDASVRYFSVGSCFSLDFDR